MSRWVEVEPLMENFGKLTVELWLDSVEEAEIVSLIGNAPSLDLVRCAECRHKRLYDGETKYYYCALEDRPNRQWSVDDWNYCYWGERKESK